ncbi:hypothetical protein WH47_08799 [Habropoda laboriosa]|uniref:Uncharacterized protein n=1 Tax=Habropoda laboriosa TaxID=597456 RepID=A0A0L7R6N1_9HYME|nr:hypothetical protein WH47_08799 [Habropoda laboriosa]
MVYVVSSNTDVHVRLCNRVCVSSGTKSCANTSLQTNGGDIIARDHGAWASYPVRHFVSAILFARYLAGYFDLDALRSLRYLFVRTNVPVPLTGHATTFLQIVRRGSFSHGSTGKSAEIFRLALTTSPPFFVV